jgi:hypothetical protein
VRRTIVPDFEDLVQKHEGMSLDGGRLEDVPAVVEVWDGGPGVMVTR